LSKSELKEVFEKYSVKAPQPLQLGKDAAEDSKTENNFTLSSKCRARQFASEHQSAG